jgi:hypothetical protein
MSRPHHNVFFYYRGPSARQSRQEGERYQQQVEDNSTKALVNVLEHGGPDVARSFLRRFAPALADGWPPGASPELSLQRGPTGALPSGRRLLLGLSVLGQVDGPLVASGDGSRVDAAILVAGVGLLAVEVKVVDDLDGPQLARHAQRWGVVEEPLLARWADVWRWARDERLPRNGIAGFLLAQFCEYLEILGFAPWAGFRSEDFDFFLQPSWEQRTIVRNRVSGAWERIADELDAGESALLGRFASGRLGLHDATAWAQTNRGESIINLTLELMQHELQLNLVGWNHDRAERLLAWLGSPLGHELTDGLRGFEVVLFEREAMADHAGAPYWQHASEREIERFDAATLADGRFSGWVSDWRSRTDETWRKLAVHVRRTYSRAEVLGAGERIVSVLVSDVRRLLPVLRSVNRR